MIFDARPPSVPGVAGLTEWCRRDRHAPRLSLAAAAGDPIALATLESQLSWPFRVDEPSAAVEILAARRTDQLTKLAGDWPDVRDLPSNTLLRETWRVALRHLVVHDLVNVGAVEDGPLAVEAMFLLEELRPSLPPITWSSFCFQVTSRRYNQSKLRAAGCYGFLEDRFDVAQLSSSPTCALRALRGRWDRAQGLPSLIAETDLRAIDDPIDVAVFWEAATATGQADQLADPLGDHLTSRLLVADDPATWWPAVLALLTGWVIP